MQDISLRERINKTNLTKKEKQAVDYLMKNIKNVVFLNGQEMAKECGFSATSLTRLVHKLGYNKFSEFMEDYEEAYRATITPKDMFQSYIESSSDNQIIKDSIQNDFTNIADMEKLIDKKTIYDIVDKIVEARKIYIVGMFASEVVVRAFAHYFWRLGKEYKEIMGFGLYNKFEYSDIKEGDVLIAVSSQRISAEVVECVKLAKKQGLITVAVTDSSTNPLAGNSDYVLIAPVKGVALDCTYVAMLALVDMVANLVASEMADQVEKNLREEAEKCSKKDLFCV